MSACQDESSNRQAAKRQRRMLQDTGGVMLGQPAAVDLLEDEECFALDTVGAVCVDASGAFLSASLTLHLLLTVD